MGITNLSIGAGKRSAMCVLLAVLPVGCATPALTKTTSGHAAVIPISTPTRRPVQAVRLEPTSVDGHTCWIIEPEVPRVPKIAGLDSQLPPHIERRLRYAFDLVQRGATYSANAEFRSVLGLCALELDARTGGTFHREALNQGLVTLDEADQLMGDHIDWRNSQDVRLATVGHSTPVLKGDVLPPIDAIRAVQLYYAFAEERFAQACEGMPGASLAYYGYARTFVLPGTQFTHAAGKSAMLQRVALRVAPQNALAGNELGVLLAQHGHLDEAAAIFRQCVATDATPETWQNLAVVYARQGDAEASRAASAASATLAAKKRSIETAANAVAANPSSSTDSLASRGGIATSEPVTEGAGSTDTEQRSGIWAKRNLIPKLPNVFRK